MNMFTLKLVRKDISLKRRENKLKREEEAIRRLSSPLGTLHTLSDLVLRINEMIKDEGDSPVYKFHIETLNGGVKRTSYIRFSKWAEIVRVKLHEMTR